MASVKRRASATVLPPYKIGISFTRLVFDSVENFSRRGRWSTYKRGATLTEQAFGDLLVEDYLGRTKAALRDLPYARRREILSDIIMHIDEGREGLEERDLIGLQNLLDRLGEPSTLALNIISEDDVSSRRLTSSIVPWLILLGGFALGIGWIVGAFFLWNSKIWRLKDKLVGTLVLPGGLVDVFLIRPHVRACSSYGGPALHTVTHCITSGFAIAQPWNFVIAVLLIVLPLSVFCRLNWILVRGYRT